MAKTVNTGYMIFLAVVSAIGGILFGYDTAVISGTIGIVTQTMLIAAVFFCICAIGCAESTSFAQLVAFRIIGGVGVGFVSIVSPIYISEISVAEKRGTLVSLYQLAVTIGFLIAYLVNYAILDISQTREFQSGFLNRMLVDDYWRGMLGSGAVPAVLFLAIIFFIPESPKWLITKGRGSMARTVLGRIYPDAARLESEYEITKSSLNDEVKSEWKELLQPWILKAVLIGSAIAILGQFMGVNAVLYYGPEIFAKAGIAGGDALFSQVLVGIVNMVTTVIALLIIDKVGRKQLVYWGVSGMIVSLVMIGIYFAFGERIGLGNGFMLAFFLFYVFCCAISISAVVFVLLSEMYPNSVRGRAMSVSGFALWVGTYLIGQLTPWLLENLTPAGTFFLFAGMCIPYILIMWKAVPETTGKTLEEIEGYWKRKRKNI